eukprot:jgi/Chrzof1/9522/Cz04g06120.t1
MEDPHQSVRSQLTRNQLRQSRRALQQFIPQPPPPLFAFLPPPPGLIPGTFPAQPPPPTFGFGAAPTPPGSITPGAFPAPPRPPGFAPLSAPPPPLGFNPVSPLTPERAPPPPPGFAALAPPAPFGTFGTPNVAARPPPPFPIAAFAPVPTPTPNPFPPPPAGCDGLQVSTTSKFSFLNNGWNILGTIDIVNTGLSAFSLGPVNVSLQNNVPTRPFRPVVSCPRSSIPSNDLLTCSFNTSLADSGPANDPAVWTAAYTMVYTPDNVVCKVSQPTSLQEKAQAGGACPFPLLVSASQSSPDSAVLISVTLDNRASLPIAISDDVSYKLTSTALSATANGKLTCSSLNIPAYNGTSTKAATATCTATRPRASSDPTGTVWAAVQVTLTLAGSSKKCESYTAAVSKGPPAAQLPPATTAPPRTTSPPFAAAPTVRPSTTTAGNASDSRTNATASNGTQASVNRTTSSVRPVGGSLAVSVSVDNQMAG